jgi:hypothetical protein
MKDRYRLKEKDLGQLLEWLGGWKVDTPQFAAANEELERRRRDPAYRTVEEDEGE